MSWRVSWKEPRSFDFLSVTYNAVGFGCDESGYYFVLDNGGTHRVSPVRLGRSDFAWLHCELANFCIQLDTLMKPPFVWMVAELTEMHPRLTGADLQVGDRVFVQRGSIMWARYMRERTSSHESYSGMQYAYMGSAYCWNARLLNGFPIGFVPTERLKIVSSLDG